MLNCLICCALKRVIERADSRARTLPTIAPPKQRTLSALSSVPAFNGSKNAGHEFVFGSFVQDDWQFFQWIVTLRIPSMWQYDTWSKVANSNAANPASWHSKTVGSETQMTLSNDEPLASFSLIAAKNPLWSSLRTRFVTLNESCWCFKYSLEKLFSSLNDTPWSLSLSSTFLCHVEVIPSLQTDRNLQELLRK